MTEATPSGDAGRERPPVVRAFSAWLGSNRMGLVVMALVVGAGAGLGAVGFRELIFLVTWLATGHNQFGQQARRACTWRSWGSGSCWRFPCWAACSTGR
jgi:hypothetical protein